MIQGIGAGPTGLACGDWQGSAQARVRWVAMAARCANAVLPSAELMRKYDPELLEIGRFADYGLRRSRRYGSAEVLSQDQERMRWEIVTSAFRVSGHGHFEVATISPDGEEHRHLAKRIIIATGYYDLPNEMHVPGETLPHVEHYYTDPYAYWRQDVVVVGGKNSAAIAALELWRNGANVTLLHRGERLSSSIKYWIKPDIENRLKAGEITGMLKTSVKEFTRDAVIAVAPDGEHRIAAKHVFALTGYHPDYRFIESLGVQLDPLTRKPALDMHSFESNVPGIHLAGVVIGGRDTGEIFIENGRFHGKLIIEALTGSRARSGAGAKQGAILGGAPGSGNAG